MNVLFGFAYCLPLVLSAITVDISANNEIDNDYVQIETFKDYGGDIVPYVSDPYIEGNDTIAPNDVVEEITVNQTVIDNTEVLDRLNNLEFSLLSAPSDENNYTEVILQSEGVKGMYAEYYGDEFFFNSSNTYKTYYYLVEDYDEIIIHMNNYSGMVQTFLSNYPISHFNTSDDYVYDDVNNKKSDWFNYSSDKTITNNGFKYLYVTVNTSNIPTVSIHVPLRGSFSVSLTTSENLIDIVDKLEKEVVTLQYLMLLNICLPMVIACVKKITFPNRKEINK